MTLMDPATFGDWLLDPQVLAEAKVQHCMDVVAHFQDGQTGKLEHIGKAACHLAYRVLDGQIADAAPVFAAVEWAREHVKTGTIEGALMRTRWLGSLTIALIFLNILKRNGRSHAAVLCAEMIDDRAVEAHPQNCLNIMRAALLLAVYHSCLSKRHDLAQQALTDARRIFRLGVASLSFRKQSVTLGDEMTRWATCMKLSLAIGRHCGMDTLGPPIAWADIAAIEPQQPFFDALAAMSNAGEWWKAEDDRYSFLYRNGYSAAKPMESVELAQLDKQAVVVDLGCGVAKLAEYFPNYAGVDVSSYVIEQNRKRRPDLAWWNASLDDLSCLNGYIFDAALCLDVMEHIPPEHVDSVLRSIAGVQAKQFVFNICCRDSKARGPSGETLHPTVEIPSWWIQKLKELFVVQDLRTEPTRLICSCVRR